MVTKTLLFVVGLKYATEFNNSHADRLVVFSLQYLPAIKPEKVVVITEGFLNKSANHTGRTLRADNFVHH